MRKLNNVDSKATHFNKNNYIMKSMNIYMLLSSTLSSMLMIVRTYHSKMFAMINLFFTDCCEIEVNL